MGSIGWLGQYAKSIGGWWWTAILGIATLGGGIPGLLYVAEVVGVSPLIAVLLALLLASTLLNARQAFVWRDENVARRDAEKAAHDAESRVRHLEQERAELADEIARLRSVVPPQLSLSPSVRELRTPGELLAEQFFQAGFGAGPRFAVITVTNDLDRDVTVVPRVYIDREEVSGAGAWAEEPGNIFAPVTAAGMHFNVGATRLLVLAVAFAATNSSSAWYPVRSRDDAAFYHDEKNLVARSLRLGSSPEIGVSLHAEGIDQTVTLDLGFSASGEPILKPPAAPPPTKSGS